MTPKASGGGSAGGEGSSNGNTAPSGLEADAIAASDRIAAGIDAHLAETFNSAPARELSFSSGNAAVDANKAIAVAKQVEEESYITDNREVVSTQYELPEDEVVVVGNRNGGPTTGYVNHYVHAPYNPNFWGDKKPKPYVAPKWIDMGKVLTDFGMLTVGGTVGGVAGAAVKLGGYTGAALSGYVAGGVGDLTVQGGNNALYALSDGNLGSKGFDKAEFALSTTLGAVLGPAAKGLSDKFGNVPYTSQINSILDNAATNSAKSLFNDLPLVRPRSLNSIEPAPGQFQLSESSLGKVSVNEPYIYVIDAENGVQVASRGSAGASGVKHTQLSGGSAVRGAGELIMTNENTVLINNLSGRYRAQAPEAVIQLQKYLEQMKLNVNVVKHEF